MILDTRPAVYRARTAAAYGDAAPIVHWPIQTPRAIGAWPDPTAFDAILFTSQLAVGFLPPGWERHKAFAVGEGTAEALKGRGFATVIQTGLTGAEMVAALKSADFRRGFYPSAAKVSVDLASAFPEKVERRAVYEMVAEDHVPDAIVAQITGPQNPDKRVIAPLFSRASAAVLARLVANIDATFDAVGISAAVFETPGPWRTKIVAAAPTLDAIATEVRRLVRA